MKTSYSVVVFFVIVFIVEMNSATIVAGVNLCVLLLRVSLFIFEIVVIVNQELKDGKVTAPPRGKYPPIDNFSCSTLYSVISPSTVSEGGGGIDNIYSR